MITICQKCECECNVIEITEEVTEEFWGNCSTVSQDFEVSDCCEANFKEVSDEAKK